MNKSIKTLVKRLLILSVCSVGAAALATAGLAKGLLSPRGLAVVILAMGVTIGVWAVFIMRKSAEEFKVRPAPSGDTPESYSSRPSS